MPKCGVCNSHYGEMLVKHGETCEDDVKAEQHSPELDDVLINEEESRWNRSR